MALAVIVCVELFLRPGADSAGQGLADSHRPGVIEPTGAPDILSEALADGEASRMSAQPTVASRANGGLSTGAGGTSIAVTSREGLPLPFVELRWEGQDQWSRHLLRDGVFTLQERGASGQLRAPGHLAAQLDPGRATYVLEADSLLVLRGDGVRELVAGVEVMASIGGPRSHDMLNEVCAHGFTDASTWGIAIDFARFRPLFGGRLDLNVEWRTEQVTTISCDLEPGLRRAYELQPPSPVANLAALPLDLQVRPDGDVPVEGPLVLDVWTRDPADPVDQSVEGLAVRAYPKRVARQHRLPPGETRVVFDSVPTGIPLAASALETSTGRHARISFSHDGSTRVLHLHAGIEARGRIHPPKGARLPDRVTMSWRLALDEASVENAPAWCKAWWGHAHDVMLDSVGAFAVPIPDRVPRIEKADWPPPPVIAIDLEVRGFVPVHRVLRLDNTFVADCGDVILEQSSSFLVLAPGHGLPEERLRYQLLRFSGTRAALEIGYVRPRPDGSVEVHGNPVRESATGTPAYRAFDELSREWVDEHWPSIPRSSILIDVDTGATRGFRLSPTGMYAAVAGTTYEVIVSFGTSSKPASGYRLGLRWDGVNLAFNQPLERGPSGLQRMSFEAPESGVELWWTVKGETSDADEPRRHALLGSSPFELTLL